MNIRAPSVAFAVTLAALPIGRESDAPDGLFTDATATSGLTFTHFNGVSGELYYPEMRDVLAREPLSVEVVELMAMTQAELGQFGEAVMWQREALVAAGVSRPDVVRRLTDALTLYEHRQPCRTLWLEEELAN